VTESAATAPANTGAEYDPYDFELHRCPYPIWMRLRNERPLYYNAKYDFYALSRYADVERCSKDWRRYSSAKGTLLEIIKSQMTIPPGSIIFDDPPRHDVYRGLLTGIFSPRAIAALEPKIREYCARSLDPLVGSGRFDFITNLGAQVPMRTIGMLLGIPEQDQEAIRDRIDDGLRLKEGAPPPVDMHERLVKNQAGVFAEYIEWRAKHPSDDVMSELLRAEFEDPNGERRRLTNDEVLGYVNLLAAAGNETTTRLIGWAGKVLAEHPEQRRDLVNDLGLVPNAIEELLRFESPSPVQARYVTEDVEHHGWTVPAGSVLLLLTGSANRDERRYDDPDVFDISREPKRNLAFGEGIHHCIGVPLARLEGQVVLETVLSEMPHYRLVGTPTRLPNNIVRGYIGMPARTS
jgi:cytochrome P450